MSPERSTVVFGSTKIDFTVRRSTRRATVSIAVEAAGEVVVTTPNDTTLARLEGIVRKKALWIVERRRRRDARHQPPQPEMRRVVVVGGVPEQRDRHLGQLQRRLLVRRPRRRIEFLFPAHGAGLLISRERCGGAGRESDCFIRVMFGAHMTLMWVDKRGRIGVVSG